MQIGSFLPLGLNMEKNPESTNTSHRLVEKVEVDEQVINKVLNQLRLTFTGEISVPEEGRIASNICVNTPEKGEVMLRFYPHGCQDSKLESGCVDFEVEALHYLSSSGVKVPSPLQFENGDVILDEKGIKIFAYECLSGKSFSASDLSVDVAKECGKFLRESIEVSQKFIPGSIHNIPEGDLDYIKKIFFMQLERFPQLKDSLELQEMYKLTNNESLKLKLSRTPKGLVHADFFFENILKNEVTGHLAAIDFGDAYYGHVIMDIVIGSMEFCVKEDRSWDLDMFQAFLEPHSEWLIKNEISFDLFYELLMVNCLRFAIYTLPTTIEDKEELSSNPYIYRYSKLKEYELRSTLEERFNGLL